MNEDLILRIKNELYSLVDEEKIFSARFGVAVSGGADSIFLLSVLSEILGKASIFVITVNHNLRPENETCADALFVQDYCRKLNVYCKRVDIERGEINKICKEEKIGLEAAARKVRYKAFEKFIYEMNLDYLCLAHNKNDQSETVLMRFLQGANPLSLAGIQKKREKYIRPILNVSRKEIEDFLNERKIEYRTDLTNFDTAFYRNRIRNNLIPYLNKDFPEWNQSVFALREKIEIDRLYLEKKLEESLLLIKWKCENNRIQCDLEDFFKLDFALQYRIVMKAIKELGCKERVSFLFIKNFCESMQSDKNNKKFFASDFIISVYNNLICFEKKIIKATETGFFVTINSEGFYSVQDYLFEVKKFENQIKIFCDEKQIDFANLEFPFVIRTKQTGDEIEDSSKHFKALSKIFDDWKVGEYKNHIPIIEDCRTSKVICIWGEVCGFKNWVLRDLK